MLIVGSNLIKDKLNLVDNAFLTRDYTIAHANGELHSL